MTNHVAYCMWHTSCMENHDISWNLEAHSHIRASIRSTPAGVKEADALLADRGFSYTSNINIDTGTPGYFVRKIHLERVS